VRTLLCVAVDTARVRTLLCVSVDTVSQQGWGTVLKMCHLPRMTWKRNFNIVISLNCICVSGGGGVVLTIRVVFLGQRIAYSWRYVATASARYLLELAVRWTSVDDTGAGDVQNVVITACSCYWQQLLLPPHSLSIAVVTSSWDSAVQISGAIGINYSRQLEILESLWKVQCGCWVMAGPGE